MKKLLAFLALILSVSLQAEWQDEWAQAVEKCQNKDYDEAEKRFSHCIREIELLNDENGIHVYVDRARLYLLQERYEEALVDLNKAISNPNLEKKELTRALVSRICAKSNLGIVEDILEDLSSFRESLPAPQEIKFTKNHIIIRNAPKCECFRNIVSEFIVRAGYCKGVNDIMILDSGNWIIERTDKCKCSESKEQAFKGVSIRLTRDTRPGTCEDKRPSTCEEWCDYFAIAGTAWCAKVFKRYDCQVGCLAAVEMIKRHICYPCCTSGDFYKTCIKPFEDILSHMDIAKCDPYWD